MKTLSANDFTLICEIILPQAKSKNKWFFILLIHYSICGIRVICGNSIQSHISIYYSKFNGYEICA